MPLYPPFPAATTSTAGLALLDGTAADIQPAGAQAAGANGVAADSGHVHPDLFGGYAALGTILGQTMPFCATASTATPAVGTIYLLRILIPEAGTTATFNMFVSTAGSALANVFAALVSTGGSLLASTANRAADTALTTTGALWQPPWVSSYAAAAGVYYGLVLIGTGTTTAPAFRSGPTSLAAAINLGCSTVAVNLRAAAGSTGQSALPGSVTMSGLAASANDMWAAVT